MTENIIQAQLHVRYDLTNIPSRSQTNARFKEYFRCSAVRPGAIPTPESESNDDSDSDSGSGIGVGIVVIGIGIGVGIVVIGIGVGIGIR